ncbi:hypothetical protein LAV33_15720 [Bacillus safensis]|uniref:hypothetical protein n=1 Tax=Bacillus safensis TaxID=561879 RepID=UPI002B253898|nr:hypothetical protein [Bacillus safensis]MEB2271730.1 hypothetical protein [Bacillus safensis]
MFQSNKELKRNVVFFAGVADFNDAEMAADFCRLGVGVDFIRFGNVVLFEACDAERRRKSSFIIHQYDT